MLIAGIAAALALVIAALLGACVGILIAGSFMTE